MSRIAVLLAAYNAEMSLQKAVDSVFASTIPVDLFIIDDGSRLPVEDFIQPSNRLRVVRLPANKGLVGALNAGLDLIVSEGYPYVARMDADDACHPNRFARQLAFLEEHPDIDLVGSWARFLDESTGAVTMEYQPPTAPADVRRALYFNSPVLHPTWMVRACVFAQGMRYRSLYPAAEDYDLLCRLARSSSLGNLPEYLLDYTVSTQGISIKRRRRQLMDRLRIQCSMFTLKNVASMAGIAKTLMLFLVPGEWVRAAKTMAWSRARS
ncbi:glycosyltransferase [Dyella sp. C11]|uniref:glycosyltransferase n=1 Tax=Dyella sp. C11 TaxID=2126991 RepID=UPI000D644ABA|nr:glycosyltransferase [Dyella sp. C11]